MIKTQINHAVLQPKRWNCTAAGWRIRAHINIRKTQQRRRVLGTVRTFAGLLRTVKIYTYICNLTLSVQIFRRAIQMHNICV